MMADLGFSFIVFMYDLTLMFACNKMMISLIESCRRKIDLH